MQFKNPNKRGKKKNWFLIFSISLFILSCLFGLSVLKEDKEGVALEVSYPEFKRFLNKGQVKSIEIPGSSIVLQESGFVNFVYTEDKSITERRDGLVLPFEFNMPELKGTVFMPWTTDNIEHVLKSGVKITKPVVKKSELVSLLINIVPSILMLVFLVLMIRNLTTGMTGKHGSEHISSNSILKFADVAGMTEEKEELQFAIDSLKYRDKYVNMGARPVKGILFEGPPGTGKTMLAKAIAGEAGCNFLSYTGSDFVEMFVGLGAQRIRKMYNDAVANKPCVIFIDEIDALGQKRSLRGGGSQESDNTLVALLSKMDGMSTESGILFIAATNRVDSLDPALLRPGRFDKVIHIGPPKTKKDREAIVAVHLRNKVLSEGVTVEALAKLCFGLTGAEIEQSLNDAILESFKNGTDGKITLEAMDTAVMKTMTKGIAKGKNHGEELKRVAIHELGHALMNKKVGRQVVKISVQPYSSGVGGVTMIDGESANMQGLRVKEEIEDDIKVLYGGYVAEKVILNSISTGASNDLERATILIKNYVGTWAFKDNNMLSLKALGDENPLFIDNQKLISDMEDVAMQLYNDVYNYLSEPKQKDILNKLLDILVKDEVIYDFDEALSKIDETEDIVNI